MGSLIAIAAWVENHLQALDEQRLTVSETFAEVRGARIRYRLVGADPRAPLVVVINGVAGPLEQWDHVQTSAAAYVQSLSYDRAGTGFSSGSTAHDAVAQADELAGLLTALAVSRPVLLVSFSASASIARVFADRHRELVGGLLFMDPYLPEIESGRVRGRHGPTRSLVRWLTRETVSCLTGEKRFELFLRRRGDPGVRTDVERRIDAVGLRLNHWWAVDQEWFVTGETAREAQATRAFGDLPLLVLTGSVSADGEAGHAWLELYRWLASRSSRGVVRQLPGVEHSGFLEEPAAQSLIESIREMRSAIR